MNRIARADGQAQILSIPAALVRTPQTKPVFKFSQNFKVPAEVQLGLEVELTAGEKNLKTP